MHRPAENKKAFIEAGLHFECTGCGQCCKTRDTYSYVYVTRDERRQLARHLGIGTLAFTRRHCQKTNGLFHLREPANDCIFLNGSRCSVYAARPSQCRTWPFWPENMTRGVWEHEVKRDCPGIGQGRLYRAQEIREYLSDESKHNKQLRAES